MRFFEWDPVKAASNLRKHGISFDGARLAFDDPFALTELDHSEVGEQRWRTFGIVEGFLVVVVIHTTHEDNEGDSAEIIRIISARRADRKERRRYEHETR